MLRRSPGVVRLSWSHYLIFSSFQISKFWKCAFFHPFSLKNPRCEWGVNWKKIKWHRKALFQSQKCCVSIEYDSFFGKKGGWFKVTWPRWYRPGSFCPKWCNVCTMRNFLGLSKQFWKTFFKLFSFFFSKIVFIFFVKNLF